MSLALSITALEIAAIVHGRTGASPKLLRFHFTSSRLLGDSLGKDHSPGMLSGGGGPGLYTAVKMSQTEAPAHLLEPDSGCGARGERLKPISVLASGNCIRISYLLRSAH